uniref:(northern house mosquito) hypothetical protein n=1 Tax=Culex pipiens TaxID=7175 RepID=A0A8D8BYW5_CULPI
MVALPRRCRQSPRRKLHRCLRCQPRSQQVVHLRRCKQDHHRKDPPEIRSNEPASEPTSQLLVWLQLRRRVLPSSTNLRHRSSSRKPPTWRTSFRKIKKFPILAQRTLKTWKSPQVTIATNTYKLVTCPRKVTPFRNQLPTIPSKPTTVFLRQAFPVTSPVSSSRNLTNNKLVTTIPNLLPA